jgi:hypothetical protein
VSELLEYRRITLVLVIIVKEILNYILRSPLSCRYFPYKFNLIFPDIVSRDYNNAPINVKPLRGGWAYVGYFIINCIPTQGILISILGLS